MKNTVYLYIMKEHGFSLGTQPMEGLISYFKEKRHWHGYSEILAYDKELTTGELEKYGLEYLGEGKTNG